MYISLKIKNKNTMEEIKISVQSHRKHGALILKENKISICPLAFFYFLPTMLFFNRGLCDDTYFIIISSLF